MLPTRSIRITNEQYRHLELLKLAWGLHTFGQVIDRLLEPQRMEKLKALDIKVEKEGVN